MEYNQELFQKLLKKAIGPYTNQAFAEKLVISRPYLQRLLSDKPSRPSRDLVINIAKHSENRVDVYEILDACGYDTALTPVQARHCMGKDEWLKANVQDALDFLGSVSASEKFDKTIFKKNYYMLYKVEAGNVSVGEPSEYKGALEDIDIFIPLKFKWIGIRHKVKEEMYAVLLGHKSEKGNIYITSFETSPSGICDVIPDMKGYYQDIDLIYPENESSVLDAPFMFSVEDINENTWPEAKSPEERLMACILGIGKYQPNTLISYYGYGFYLDDEPALFKEFLENHKETMKADKRLEGFYEDVVDNGKDPIDIYQPYNEISGAADVIAMVMEDETKIPFLGLIHENEYEENRNCVMLPWDSVENGNVIDDASVDIVRKYARELKVPKIETCFYHTYVNADTYYKASEDLVYED